MISDFLSLAINNLINRKTRSLLTIIGIFIGISAVVALISVGQGMHDSISQEFEKMGADKIIILPGATGGRGMMNMLTSAIKLTDDDLKIIKSQIGVDQAGGMVFKTVAVKYRDQIKYTLVSGIPTDTTQKIFEDTESYEIEKGHRLRRGDNKGAILGYDIAHTNYFNKKPSLRDKIYIMGKAFVVRGILKKIGNKHDDTEITITLDAANELFGTKGEYDLIIVKVKQGFNPSEVAEKLKEKLRRKRGEKEGEESFQVQTTEQLIEKINSVLGIVNIVLVGIAAISLLVGGIGIMNTMYTSVLERTKEIGVMKAIGARNYHILILFLFESGMLGLIGGLIGVGLGICLAKGVEIMAINSGLSVFKATFDLKLIFGSLAFSFFVGTLSGLFPARRAAKLNPVDALRYE